MERIVIEVSAETAKDLKNVSPKTRLRIEKYLAQQIDEIILRSKVKDFKKFLDEIGKEAEAKGLTEEILQEILQDDE